MVEFVDECVGCPPEMGCLGSSCPNKRVKHLYCDQCNNEVYDLYEYEDEQLCADCILRGFEKVEEI